ncbi:hypothetical protein C8R42DRAFT_648907 [Lentinula raphanica]|nr:hypothetical protein C8R42DRAFT_648907 [Lentinula raphanica]
MARGRKKAHKGRNITGLRNQNKSTLTLSEPMTSETLDRSDTPENRIFTVLDSNTRVDWEREDALDSKYESDIDHEAALEDLDSKLLAEELAKIALKEDNDDEWIPVKYRKIKKARPTEYAKGPGIKHKSECTQYRYKKSWQGARCDHEHDLSDLEGGSEAQHHELEIEKEIEKSSSIDCMNEEDGEFFEDDQDERVGKPRSEIKPWDELRTQLKAELKQKINKIPASQLNRYLILLNFANLRLKGESRMKASEIISKAWNDKGATWFARRVCDLARYYQTFEHLPAEHQGGNRTNQLWLHRDDVRSSVLKYLNNLPTGEVTPRILCHQVNKMIFPQLDIVPKQPISLRTARRWLIKMGWSYSVVKKGVYMDGHEREDVVRYRQQEFLPTMLEFEHRMAKYEWDEEAKSLKRTPPDL